MDLPVWRDAKKKSLVNTTSYPITASFTPKLQTEATNVNSNNRRLSQMLCCWQSSWEKRQTKQTETAFPQCITLMRECEMNRRGEAAKKREKESQTVGMRAENGSVGSSGRSRRGSARSTPFKANLKHQHSCLPHKDLDLASHNTSWQAMGDAVGVSAGEGGGIGRRRREGEGEGKACMLCFFLYYQRFHPRCTE